MSTSPTMQSCTILSTRLFLFILIFKNASIIFIVQKEIREGWKKVMPLYIACKQNIYILTAGFCISEPKKKTKAIYVRINVNKTYYLNKSPKYSEMDFTISLCVQKMNKIQCWLYSWLQKKIGKKENNIK